MAETEHAAVLAEEKVMEQRINKVLDVLRPAGAAAVPWTFDGRDSARSLLTATNLMRKYASAWIEQQAERQENEDRWEGEGGSLLRYTDE